VSQPSFPYSQSDRAVAVASGIHAMVLVAIGWFGVRNQDDVTTDQIPYLVSSGLGGVFAFAAIALSMSAALDDE
jgi:hypothetical protein